MPSTDVWTQPLWPLHLKPLPDELLSSWLARLAHAHGMKVQTFTQQLLGHRWQVWNRDIDRICPQWLIEPLCRNTATSLDRALQTSLRAYEGRLYRKYRETGVVTWILPLQMYHRKRRGFGLQYCPVCIAADETPYFRKRWRIAIYTFCVAHRCQLRDRCPVCSAAVIFHRRELGRPNNVDGGPITLCNCCGFDLREARPEPVQFYDGSIEMALLDGLAWLDIETEPSVYGLQDFNVLRHFMQLFANGYRGTDLLGFAENAVGIDRMTMHGRRAIFETLDLATRHHLVQLGFWYMADLPGRLTAAWRSAAITYSALLRDFDDYPREYGQLVQRFANWRDRLAMH